LINNFDREGDYISFAGLTKPLYKHSVLNQSGCFPAEKTGAFAPVTPIEAALAIQHRTAAIAADFLCAGPAVGMDGEREMKASMPAKFLIPLLLGAGMLTFMRPAYSDIRKECSQEAQDYGVSPEQMDSYVEGCVQSRGGYTDAAAVETNVPAQEGDEQAGNTQNAVPEETAATMVEGANGTQ